MLNRRRFLNGAAVLGSAAAAQLQLPAWARTGAANNMYGISALSGTEFHLRADRSKSIIDGKSGRAITINGQLPAPLLRWREGDDVTLHLSNGLDEDTSIHWHGILLPPEMDGVPGLSGFAGVKPGETFTYRFPLKQAGTYWYHSHSGLQEQSGHYGPIIIEPKDADPVQYDREYVIVLSDWTFENPNRLFAKLKKHSENYNFQKRTLVDFFRDAGNDGFGDALSERAMWGRMRMDPADIADVTGATYTYLINGHGPGDNWTGLFSPGERVRLRIINASAMTIFNFRLPELPMSVVQADGLNVKPVETDELQIGVAETYDVIVHPHQDKAFTIMAESIDRSGYARAILTPRMGMVAAVPPLRERPTLTMRDMAMSHGSHGGGHEPEASMHEQHARMDHSGHNMNTDDRATSSSASPHGDHNSISGHDKHDSANMTGGMSAAQEHNHPTGPGVVGLAETPSDRLNEPGLGLENQPHRVLTYADLSALDMNPDMHDPERELELHLTGNMERYMWSFDGKKFSEVEDAITFHEGERLRLTLVNDTMMSHPIHLHGMFFDVVKQAHHDHTKARKHTIIVKPGEKLSVDVTADAVGDWAFHCHLLYHMMAGMMQVVSVKPRAHHQDHQMDHSGHEMHQDSAS
ncbi:copper resistance system multicopper oxidase [Hyphococcus flavus]|uniref:Copper resistance system multicopper oxidase n=1 Tax=Hyphococcus flavus TaxID=1866326 RepID=A0AAF0CF32_9PROT|nr:copper resistance system multicopper oxidase [Hyphococcus flavus]WDI30974.1 copper resistance system multicopper oxidase [Hyphococcus flavus]